MASESQRISHITLCKLIVLSICLCVFLFALQAKLAQYDGPSLSVTPIKAAKLWDGEHRLQLPAPAELSGLALLICPFLLVMVPAVVRRPRATFERNTAAPVRFFLWQAPLFFRPPPAL